MEERIIDDEYSRGIRLKKTKDGYVDVTDESVEDKENIEDEVSNTTEEKLDGMYPIEDTGEEVVFEFPDLEEDDEDLVNLSPEEAIELRKQKAEAEKKRNEDYVRLCEEGQQLLSSENYKTAELKFEKALMLELEDSTDAIVGYWTSKTSAFKQPDVLGEYYVDEGYENLENDLGIDAINKIKEENKEVFEKRIEELSEEEKPLSESVTKQQKERRKILKGMIKKRKTHFIIALSIMVVIGVCWGYFITRINSRPDSLYAILTVAMGAIFFIGLGFFSVFTNKFIRSLRMNKENEDISSSVEGEHLVHIRRMIELYKEIIK